jgi:alpha-acetolactate decarboxylase
MTLLRCLPLIAALAACTTPPSWDGRVAQWGTLRQVLRDGDTTGKVGVLDAASSFSLGIGAVESLHGEILVLDGRAWIAEPKDDAVTVRSAREGDRAAFFAGSRVDRWREIAVDRDLSPDDLEAMLDGLSPAEAFPFIVRGPLEQIESHVLNGRCPFNPKDTNGADPLRAKFDAVEGVLAGFFSRQPPGTLVHHGTRTHVHVLIDGDRRFMGHVDAARVRRGARLFVPATP